MLEQVGEMSNPPSAAFFSYSDFITAGLQVAVLLVIVSVPAAELLTGHIGGKMSFFFFSTLHFLEGKVFVYLAVDV